MRRLQNIALNLPEAERVDLLEWGEGHTSFRVRGKAFVFCGADGSGLDVKLTKEEAAAVVATKSCAAPSGYGLGRHGWISVSLPARPAQSFWEEVEEWIRTSYTLIAPKGLARSVLAEDDLL
jgi:predicted DNA-binding protein (MmcQ/YjbR family)